MAADSKTRARLSARLRILEIWRACLALAAHRQSVWWLAVFSWAEAIFLPLPSEAVLVPMCLARPKRALHFALIATLASTAGGITAFVLGLWAYQSLLVPLLRSHGFISEIESVRAAYREHGAWIVLIGGFTPIPYKAVAIAGGASGQNIFLFGALSLVARGARFFLIALILRRWGEAAKRFIERHLALATLAGAAVLCALALVILL